MWVQDEDSEATESDEESYISSGDEGEIQFEILEKQRDDANQKLSELEEVSNQLLKEISVLEMQFQIERSCRESAEALAVKVTKENKALKRRSQMVMPLISELPENPAAEPFDAPVDPTVNGDVVDFGVDTSGDEPLLLENQAKIADLQASVDGLLTEKLQLEQHVEDLTKELDQLREQLALEVEEKEALMRKLTKQSKTMNKIKRVSQLVTEEFTEMSQKLQLEEGLRQHAEVFAHQVLEQQKETHQESTMHSTQTAVQLQQALEQISNINTALSDIQLYYQEQAKPNQSAVEEPSILSELQNLREQLEKSEEERKSIETQLSEANSTVTKLQEEVKQLQESVTTAHTTDEPEEKSTSAAPPAAPPPPPPPPPPSTIVNSLDFLRSRRKEKNPKESATSVDLKSKAVDEMMERIKNGIVLRPINQLQEGDSAWKDQRSEKRKSAVTELTVMLDNIKRQQHRRVPSRRGTGRNVGEAELLMVLQRRRRVLGENQETSSPTQTQDPQPVVQRVPAAVNVPWASEKGSAPVLRRLKQNREKRDSRIRASALIISQEN